MKADFTARMGEYLDKIEGYLASSYNWYDTEPQHVLFDSMRYSLLAGGKRLRPVFALDFCRMCGGEWEKALPFGAAVEMIHTYSLIHDDLPCMDNDDFRRGKPTNHKVYGEATAVLAGDGLLTAAFSSLANAPFTPEQRIRAVDILAHCSGELGMVGGQILDMAAENRACTEEEILDIQSRKTGALICAACMLGVVAGNGSEEQLHAAECFAKKLGLAFQIRDDMLDVIGDAKQLGKSTGTDINKNTFVRLYGIDKCDALVRDYTDDAISALQVFTDADYMRQLANELTGRTL
jgi:geranylgeranyl diphosphate synthase type II